MTIHKDFSKPFSRYVCVSAHAMHFWNCHILVCLVEAWWGEITLLGVWNPDKKQIQVWGFLSCCYLGDYWGFF